MKITYDTWINIINQQLIAFQQKILVVSINKNEIKMSNGSVLSDKDIAKFKKRILNKKTNEWVKNSDNLFNGIISEREIRSSISRIGGVACQQTHGKKLKQNLNCGTPWNKVKTGLKGTPHTAESKLKISAKNKGIYNGMYGRRMTIEQKTQQSKIMKELILAGKFTPNSNNRNTHWDSYYNGVKYRSSWEALYQFYDPDAHYEELRIPYILDNREKIYIVDFINHTTKLCVEIKPKELCSGKKFNAKMHGLRQWATAHQYTVMVVDKEWFLDQTKEIEYSKFDPKTVKKIKALLNETSKKN